MAKVSIKSVEVPTANRLKSFKSSEMMESFYRYVHENSLREEACMILQYITSNTKAPKARRKRKAKVLQ